MIAAADLLAYQWGNEEKSAFKKFIREIILPLNTMQKKKNNWANWGTVLVLSAAVYLEDEKLFATAKDRFKELIDIQISSEGTFPLEICRSNDKLGCKEGPHRGKNGLWYTNFTLMPTTLAAEILNINGSRLFDYHLPDHVGLRAAYEKANTWNLHPETFPFYAANHGDLKTTKFIGYLELLSSLWPDPAATELLRRYRPLTTEMAMPDLTFTHGELGPQ